MARSLEVWAKDLLERCLSVIQEDQTADEHEELITELKKAVGYLQCHFCPATMPDIESAIRAGWEPSFICSEVGDEYSAPVCNDCYIYYMQFNEEFGDFELRPYLRRRLGF